MLRNLFHKLLSLSRLKAPYYFWKKGYLKNTGWLKSVALQESIDAQNNPLPWYTYPAIEYIKQLDFSDKEIFEYGSGNSTLFWSTIAQKVISVENNPAWYEKVSQRIRENIEIQLRKDKLSYIHEILRGNQFDVIIIDGSHRLDCAKAALQQLKRGGMIILDNSDWYVKTAQVLREANLIQVDMTGLGPINNYTWTTSFFLHREFCFQPKGVNQPEFGINALRQYALDEGE